MICILLLIIINTCSPQGTDDIPKIGLINNLSLPQVTIDKTSIDARIELINKFEIMYIREGIYWSQIETNPTEINLDHVANRLKNYKVQDILALYAYSNSLYTAHDKFYAYADWRLFHRSAVALEKALLRLPKIDYYEILNEMNSEQYFQSNGDSIATYKQLLGVLSRVLRRNGKTVVTGGLLLEGDFEVWLQMLASKAAYDLYDILSIHPYCYPKRLSEAKFNAKSFSNVIRLIHKLWRQNGLEIKPIWITEIGWPHRDSVSDLERSWGWINTAEYCDRIADLRQVAESLKIERVYLYAFEDDQWYRQSYNSLPFGLIDKNAASKGLNCLN